MTSLPVTAAISIATRDEAEKEAFHTEDGTRKMAEIYRMVRHDHLRPFGLKSKVLLKRQGYVVYDHHLLEPHSVSYGRVYPFDEALAGILTTAGALVLISVPDALFIGTVGAMNEFKAV